MINWSTSTIPLEIIYHICRWLKKSELYPCLLVNKQWYSVILPIYWRNIRISNNKEWTDFICSTVEGKGIQHIRNFSFSDIQEMSSDLNIYEYKTLDFVIDPRLKRFTYLIEKNNSNLISLEFIGIKALTEEKLLNICKYCPHLEGLYIHRCGLTYYVKDFEKLSNYCPNLKRLHLGRNSLASFISDMILKTILINFKELNELTISFSTLTDASANIWEHAKKSVAYDFSKIKNCSNSSLNAFDRKGLTWLSLSEIGYPLEIFNLPGKISSQVFWKGMLTSIGPQLEALDLSACGRYLNEKVLYLIEENCPGLIALNLSANYFVTDNVLKHLLPKLTHLCHLHLCACNLLTDKALEYIGDYAPPGLQFLGLCMRGNGNGGLQAPQFSPQNLYRMVTRCEKLKSISLGPVDKEIKERIHQYLKSRSDQYLNRGEDFTVVVVEDGHHYSSSSSNKNKRFSSSSGGSFSTSTEGKNKKKVTTVESLHPFHCFCKESFLFHNYY